MIAAATKSPFVAIACGGTGGHLFPGLAVAEQLQQRGCDVALLISPKDIDQQAVKSASGLEIFTLPAVGLQNRNYFSFAGSFVKSLFAARKIFRRRKPDAVLAMGGFTSAPPIFVAKDLGAKTFLHESNTIPGRANRYLARFVNEAFVGFPEAAARLQARKVTVTGTPVRPQFQPARSCRECRTALGLTRIVRRFWLSAAARAPAVLNEMILSALPLLARKKLAMAASHRRNDFEKVKSAYAARGIKAVVKPFLAEMDLALGAATAASAARARRRWRKSRRCGCRRCSCRFRRRRTIISFSMRLLLRKPARRNCLSRKIPRRKKLPAILMRTGRGRTDARKNAIRAGAMARAEGGGANRGNHFGRLRSQASRRRPNEGRCDLQLPSARM